MNKTTAGKKVGIYARVSTDGQTVDNQLRELRAVAKRERWKIVKVFRDDGISGAKGRDQRPGFNDLCKSVTQGKIDMVAAWSVDRLGFTFPMPTQIPHILIRYSVTIQGAIKGRKTFERMLACVALAERRFVAGRSPRVSNDYAN